MKSFNLLVAFVVLFVTQFTYSQRNYQGEYNRIGLQGGVTMFDIKTDNFTTSASQGFTGGFTTRGAFYNDFDLIYGVNFYDLNVDIQARENNVAQAQKVNFGIFGVQLNLFASYNIIGQHLTIEAGPAVQFSSKLTTDKDKQNYIIDGYNTLTAKDIEGVSKININGVVGLTGGFEDFRIWAHYQYGINNLLDGINDNTNVPNGSNFEGNLTLINIGAVFYL